MSPNDSVEPTELTKGARDEISSRLVVSLAPIALVGVVVACTGDPPVHNGDGLLEFGPTQINADGLPVPISRLALYQAAPFEHWGYHATALVGVTDTNGPQVPFDLTEFPLRASTDGTSEPFMRYTSAVPYWSSSGTVSIHDQHEIDLFARDPAEQAATVRGLPDGRHCIDFTCGNTGATCSTDQDCTSLDIDLVAPAWLNAWVSEWAFGRSPLVPRMIYPQEPNLTSTDDNGQVTNPPSLNAGIVWSDFWTSEPRGPGAAPDGSGSIKAVKIFNKGVCAAFQPYTASDGSGLLQQVATKLPQFVLSAVAQSNNQTNGTCDTLEQQFLVTAPYLDFATDQEAAQHGGFFFGTQLNVEDSVTGGGPNFFVYFKEAWSLFDGRLSTQGEVIDLSGQGTNYDDIAKGFPPPLTREMDAPLAPGATPTTLAEAIWSISYKRQRFTGIPGLQAPLTACTPRADGRVIVEQGVDEAPCESWRRFISDTIAGAATDVGADIGLDAAEQNEVVGTFNAQETVGGDNVYKNIRCADVGDVIPPDLPNGGEPFGPACYYAMPAKRLNIYPDGVELVFLDQLEELDNPIYPIWLMLLEFENQGLITTMSPLCDDPVAQDAGSLGPARTLQALPSIGHATFNCTGPASDCGSSGNNCCCDVVTVSP